MTVIQVLRIPNWHPTPLNKLLESNWQGRNRMKRKDRDMVWAYWAEAKFQRATQKRRVSVTLVYPKGKRFHDPDAMQKSLGDALVACGALRNDSSLWVEWTPVLFDRGPQKTIIVLEDI